MKTLFQVFFLIAVVSGTLSAQKAEITLKLSRPDGKPASGIVQISGSDTTITDNSFVSPKNYILRTVTGINDISKQPEIKYWPNPTLTGNLNVTITGSGRLEGILDIVDFSGKHIGKMDLSKDDGLKLNVKPGNILIQYENRHEKQVFKIVNFAEQLNVNIFQGNTFGLSSGNGLKSNNIFNDEFRLTVTDPANNWRSYLLNFSAPVGTKYSVDDLLEWSEKTVKYNLKTNTDTKIIASKAEDLTVLDEKTTSSGILPTQTIPHKFNNETGLKINYELISAFTDTVTLARTQFANEEVTLDTIRNSHFYSTINGNGEQFRVLSGAHVLAIANIGKQSFFKMPADSIKVNIEVSGSGMVTKVLPVNLGKGIYAQTVNLEKANYSHTLAGNLLSSIPGKVIEDGTPVYIIKDFQNAPTDTSNLISANGKFTFAWSDNNQTVVTKIGCINVSGHQGNSLSFTMDDDEIVNITFNGLQYNLSQPVYIQNQYDEIVAGAKVTGGDSQVITDEKGTATVTISNLATDDHNLPLPVYSITLVVTNNTNLSISSHYIDAVAGINSEAQLKVLQYYEQWFYGTNTTPDGALVQVWLNGEVKESVMVSNHSYETKHIKRPTKTFEADSVTISKENYHTFVQKNVTLIEGGTKLEATLTQTIVEFNHKINGLAQSSIEGKQIIDGTQIYISKSVGDTVWVNTSNGAFTYTFKDNNQVTPVKIGSKNVAGHTKTEITQNIDDNENANLTFQGLTYSLTKPVKVQNQYSENISDASIVGGDATIITDANGLATLQKSNLSSDINNLPLANYTLALTITKNNIQTEVENVNATTGTNPQTLLNVVQEYEQWLYGNSTTPDGALVQVWKGGTAVQNATVTSSAYETDHIKRTTKTFVADSITITKTGYNRFTQFQTTLNEGANKLEAILEQIPLPLVHDFDILLRDINGNTVTDLTQTYTMSDGTTFTLTPDANGVIHFESTNTSNSVSVSNNSSKYSDFQVYRKTSHNLAELNYAQISSFNSSPGPVTLNLTGIPSQLVEYVAAETVSTPSALVGTYGSDISITHPVIRDMMGGRNGGNTTKFVPTPSVPTVDVVQFLFNFTNNTQGAAIDQAQINRAKGELDKILSIYSLNDGTSLLDYTFYQISSLSDSRWQAVMTRGGNNTAYTFFHDGNAFNGVTTTTSESSNGMPRIKSSNSKYNIGTTTGIIFEEIYQQFTNNADPTQGTAVWVTDTSGNVQETGIAIARLIYLLNQGTSTQ